MNAAQFCAEYGYELKSGRISFSKKVINQFIDIYTYLTPQDVTDKMREIIKISVMIDLHTAGYSKFGNHKDLPPEKIELPDFVFK